MHFTASLFRARRSKPDARQMKADADCTVHVEDASKRRSELLYAWDSARGGGARGPKSSWYSDSPHSGSGAALQLTTMKDLPAFLYSAIVVALTVSFIRWRTSPVRIVHVLSDPMAALNHRPTALQDTNCWGSLDPITILLWCIKYACSWSDRRGRGLQEGMSLISSIVVLHRKVTLATCYTRTQYLGRLFKIPFFSAWMVIVTSPDAIEDIRSRPDSELSLSDAFAEVTPSLTAPSDTADA